MEDYAAQALALAALSKASKKADLENGKVPASQLPSYVDDTIEGYYYYSKFYEDAQHITEITEETGKIYIDISSNKSYRWTGSVYTRIDECPAFGEIQGTIYEGNKGKANADAIAKKPGEITTGKQYTIDGQTVTAAVGAEAFNNLANNKAAGAYSHAEGLSTTTSGPLSHAEGQSTIASGTASHAEGGSTTGSGVQSHAEGYGTIASGTASHAEGSGTAASGAQSHSEGLSATASGDYSHAEGNRTTASGNQSHSEGNGTKALGNQSHAEGAGTTASGAQSHAEGSGTKASSANQHVQGKFNVEDANGTYAFIIGNGTADNARHNAFAIDWDGLIYVNGAATGVDVAALAATIGDINAVLEEVL